MGSGPVQPWQWMDDKGKWQDTAKADADFLEQQYQKMQDGDGTAVFTTTKFSFNKDFRTVYLVDFVHMTQSNTESRSVRPIRRGAVEATPGDDQLVPWFSRCPSEWRRYDVADARVLESLLRQVGGKGKATTKDFSWNKEFGTQYCIDFEKWQQINEETRSARDICRGDPALVVMKPSSAVWQFWKASASEWKDAGEKDNKLLEAAYLACPSHVFCSTEMSFNPDVEYLYDWGTMTQCNCRTGTSVKLRRLDKDAPAGEGAAPPETSEGAGYAAAYEAEELGSDLPPASAPKAPTFVPTLTKDVYDVQMKLGPQSRRGDQKAGYGVAVTKDPHARKCFDQFLETERKFAGTHVVFYHSYSDAALLYEVQAALGRVLFRFKSDYGALPRLLRRPFGKIPTAGRMLEEFPKWGAERDHHQDFRMVGLCGVESLLAGDNEMTPGQFFLQGYSVMKGAYKGLLGKLFADCGVPKGEIKDIVARTLALAREYNLDTQPFGGETIKSGRTGHMLQILVRRELCDEYVYPSEPYGVPDESRMPLEAHLRKDVKAQGQVRITCNPDYFLRATCVRMFTASADKKFHEGREEFQKKLVEALQCILGDKEVRRKAAQGVWGDELPDWWDDDSQDDLASIPKGRFCAPFPEELA
eukprot:TRINITY_DN1535_c0_g1_i1.p1 TRINITY_DN1535_c0_g1~~TRINITY_DN1535_c0_g1_i1.p1  ORF type:complete len:643 (+),score=206.51 TRINITY_DN1535_c0_g1_i1:99-2027(+)